MTVLKLAGRLVPGRFAGLSSDTKPTEATNPGDVGRGATFFETDSGALYFTADGTTWVLKGFSSGINEVTNTQAVAAAENYGVNDVLSSNVTTGVAWNFADVVSAVGRSGYITKAQITVETTAQAHKLTLFLFDAVPTSELDDNKVNTGPSDTDRPNYLGKIDFPALESLGAGNSDTVATPSTAGNLPFAFTCAVADVDLYGILVTRDAFTNETPTDDYVITLSIEEA